MLTGTAQDNERQSGLPRTSRSRGRRRRQLVEVSEIVGRYFSVRNDEMEIGGVPVRELAQAHGTPLFVYDRGVLQKKLSALRAALPSRFAIHYSVKANPNLHLLKFFLDSNCGLEIASAGELHQALK